ncbi:MAG: MazG nucleotide pyrophosphohydrolase domain-containing protein [archaeon]|nr:MazG nucleotide pyrophosphohydrolase domain-containing protein [archaeon]
MEMKELLDFVELESVRLINHYGVDLDNDKRILLRIVKLNEEVGELCDAVLSYFDSQRKDKLAGFDRQDLDEEFADVIITTLLLAEVMDVDVGKALEKKIEKINGRYDG